MFKSIGKEKKQEVLTTELTKAQRAAILDAFKETDSITKIKHMVFGAFPGGKDFMPLVIEEVEAIRKAADRAVELMKGDKAFKSTKELNTALKADKAFSKDYGMIADEVVRVSGGWAKFKEAAKTNLSSPDIGSIEADIKGEVAREGVEG